MITDQTNKVVWRWDNQDPFGANVPDEDPDGDGIKFTCNLRFPGQYADRETGTYYNYFRDYDPNTGRYVQSDPIGVLGGLNLYSYVYSHPMRLIDPLGLWGELTHEKILDKAFEQTDPLFVTYIKAGSAEVDSIANQFGSTSYLHAMRGPGQPVAEAKRQMCAFVEQKMMDFNRFKNSNDIRMRLNAYRSLGMALHPITDSTSPVHRGFQEWHPADDGMKHGNKFGSLEGLDALTPALLAETVGLINRAIAGEPCPCGQ